MKNRLWVSIICAGVIGVICFAGAPLQTYVGTTSVPILPPRNVTGAAAFANPSTNAVGSLARSGSRFYMFTAEGIFTDGSWAPTHTSGVVSNMQAISAGARSGLVIINASTSVVWCSVGDAAVVEKGLRLAPHGGGWYEDRALVQERVNAISESVSNLVTAIEL